MTMFSTDRQTHRHTFIAAWAKAQAGQPLAPVEAQIVQIARLHPEYQRYLEHPDQSLDRDFSPDAGEVNPFLHMGLHLAIQDQLSIDQPTGIRRLYQRLAATHGDAHTAEHRLMECLAAALWRAQREHRPFNTKAYLKCIKRTGGGQRSR